MASCVVAMGGAALAVQFASYTSRFKPITAVAVHAGSSPAGTKSQVLSAAASVKPSVNSTVQTVGGIPGTIKKIATKLPGGRSGGEVVGLVNCKSTNLLAVSVSGNHLADDCGNVVQLRGVNRSGPQYACVQGWGIFDGPVDPTDLGYIKAWGVNAVRVPLNEDCWLGINGVKPAYSGANYQSAIETLVTNLNALGIRVILDLGGSAPGTTLATAAEPMPDQDHAPAFWTSVASTFKANPSVLFDIFNESFPDSDQDTTSAWSCILHGGTCPGVSYTAAGSQELVTDIRATGAANVIMTGGPQYGGTLGKWMTYRPQDPLRQLGASIHIYFDTPVSPLWNTCDLQSCWTSVLAPLATTAPIVIGEFGELDCGDELINGTGLKPTQASLMDWADQHGISYLAWTWDAYGKCTDGPSLISNYNGTPTNYGIGIMNHFLGLAH